MNQQYEIIEQASGEHARNGNFRGNGVLRYDPSGGLKKKGKTGTHAQHVVRGQNDTGSRGRRRRTGID